MISIEEYSEDLRQYIVLNREHESSRDVKKGMAKDPTYEKKLPILSKAFYDCWITQFVFPEGEKVSVLFLPKGSSLMSDPEFEIYSFTQQEIIARVETIPEVEVILNALRKAANS